MELPAAALTSARAVHDAVGTHRERLLAVVRRRGGTQVDAEEILQIAIQRALERADQVHDAARVEAWLGRVVRNVLIDELRKRRQPILPVNELEPMAVEDEGLDCRCVLVQAAQLKPMYATILRRVIVEGMSMAQVASELGLTVNNATVRLHRARLALKAQLASHCGTTTARACSDCGCQARGCCPDP